MKEFDIELNAENSSGKQTLFISKQNDNEYSLTLCGKYDGKGIQIDFDCLSRDEMVDLSLRGKLDSLKQKIAG